MDNDDQPVGRILSRREVLKLMGTAGAASAAFLVGCDVGATKTETATPAAQQPPSVSATAAGENPTQAAAPSSSPTIPNCVVKPEQTEGPYFVDEMLDRSDIRSDPATGVVSEGTLLSLAFAVSQLDDAACVPLEGAQVDIWHCDGLGVYSDVDSASGQKFLRGYQLTDASGTALFKTVYPGWYPGRTVHIHFKIRTDTGYEFTSQLFFDDALTDEVYQQQPYASRGERTLQNEGDNIYQDGGDQLLLDTVVEGDGYAATFAIALNLSDA